MRKFLLSAVALTGIAVASQFAGAGAAQAQVLAQPAVATAPAVEPGLIHQVQYWDWRRHERHDYWRWRRHEAWRHHYWGGYHRHW